ncbi:hypothetical protein L209DRAFT_754612 [Thermothelomyces heterothallicus CBS 203.75]
MGKAHGSLARAGKQPLGSAPRNPCDASFRQRALISGVYPGKVKSQTPKVRHILS